MKLSVVIPTHGRPEKLLACLAGLARQSIGPSAFEVLVGLDGGDETAAKAVRHAFTDLGLHGAALACARRGPAFVRNRLIERAAGEVLLLLNDDVVPDADCAAIHLREQQALDERNAMILGSAPWKVHAPDRLFDRLIRDTSMVFFYDRMDADPDRDWGFRHAWTLNLSLPKRLIVEAGWFSETLPSPRFEDIELAWRLCARGGRVLYRPEAAVVHDHRYEPVQYLEREYGLGYDAWSLAHANGACARAIFGRDIAARDEIEYSRQFVERERASAARLEDGFHRLAGTPASAVDGTHAPELVRLAYEQHLLLKRYVWRQGLIAAADRAPAAYRSLLSGSDSEDVPDRVPSSASRSPTSPPTLSRL